MSSMSCPSAGAPIKVATCSSTVDSPAPRSSVTSPSRDGFTSRSFHRFSIQSHPDLPRPGRSAPLIPGGSVDTACQELLRRRLAISRSPLRSEIANDIHSTHVSPELVNGPIDVPPGPGDLHVGLIDEPVAPDAVTARPSRFDEQVRESLDPPVQGHVVDLDATFGEQFFQIPVGQSVAQVPAHGDQDDLGWEPESSEFGNWRLDGSDETPTLHPDSLVESWPRHEPRRFQTSAHSMQQCLSRRGTGDKLIGVVRPGAITAADPALGHPEPTRHR